MLNVVAIMGRLTADPELKTTQNGVSVCSFSVAVDRNYVPQGQERQADFIDVVAWRSTADFVCRHFSKGKMIGVAGEIQTRMYEDKQGNKRKAVEIKANYVSFAGDKQGEGQRQSSETSSEQHPVSSDSSSVYPSGSSDDFEEILHDDDDLPF